MSGTDGCGTSAGIQDLAVYGISFDDIVIHEDEKEACSYAGILENLKAFLETQKDTGRKIVILSHTGLHTLGIQRESSAKEWSGSEKYNPDLSAEVVCLLNKYAESYGMEIVFLFGHNHSKQEGEFYLGPGDRIDSTQNYAQRSVSSQDLKFAYAHAGYLTGRSNGTKHYSVLSLTQDGLSISLRKLSE